jgi:hypothetical protein
MDIIKLETLKEKILEQENEHLKQKVKYLEEQLSSRCICSWEDGEVQAIDTQEYYTITLPLAAKVSSSIDNMKRLCVIGRTFDKRDYYSVSLYHRDFEQFDEESAINVLYVMFQQLEKKMIQDYMKIEKLKKR